MNAQHCFETLCQLGFVSDETPYGPAIQLSAAEAFVYSAVTGSGYVVNPFHAFSVRAYSKIVGATLAFHPIESMFTASGQWNTPRELASRRPFLLDGHKTLLFVDVQSEDHYRTVLEAIHSSSRPLGSVLIQRVEVMKRGAGLEPFYEYVFGYLLKRRGYIVENQFALSATSGSPDLVGFGCRGRLAGEGFALTGNDGLFSIELCLPTEWLPRVQLQTGTSRQSLPEIVGEVKTASPSMAKQVKKYLETGYFDQALEIFPAFREASQPGFLTGYVRSSGDPWISGDKSGESYAKNSQVDYVEWVALYLRMHVVASLTAGEFQAITLVSDPTFASVLEWCRRFTLGEIGLQVAGVLGGAFE